MKDQGNTPAPVITPAAVGAAGMASATAAVVTSSFGVAGTIIGAAITSMIITGGSAILRSYMEGASGRLKTRAQRARAGMKSVGRPDLRDNLAGRMRAALGWFSHLSLGSRRSILKKGLIAAAVAFVLSMGVVFAAERVIGNSLSCGFWSECPEGREPGVHLGGGGNGATPTLDWVGRGDSTGDVTENVPSDSSGGSSQGGTQSNPGFGIFDRGGNGSGSDPGSDPGSGSGSGTGNNVQPTPGQSGGGGVQNNGGGSNVTPTPDTGTPATGTPSGATSGGTSGGEVSTPTDPVTPTPSTGDPAAEDPSAVQTPTE